MEYTSLHSRELPENIENSRTLRTQALGEFDRESWETISNRTSCDVFGLCEMPRRVEKSGFTIDFGVSDRGKFAN